MSLLGSLFGGLLGSGASSFVSMLGQYIGGKQQYEYQRKLQEQSAQLNYDYGMKAAQNTALNSPTWNRTALQNAGYNPMLAVQNATSGANASSGWTSTGQAPAYDYSQGLSSGIANAQSFARLKNEINQTESNVKANEATARNQNAEASNREAENPYISKREEANLGKLSAETSKLNRETDYFDALEDNLIKTRELQERLGMAGVGAQIYSANKAYNASVYSANKSAEMKTLSEYTGKWTQDKLNSFAGSRFGRDLAKLGRKIYRN